MGGNSLLFFVHVIKDIGFFRISDKIKIDVYIGNIIMVVFDSAYKSQWYALYKDSGYKTKETTLCKSLLYLWKKQIQK